MKYDAYFSAALSTTTFLAKVGFEPVDLSKSIHRDALKESLKEIGTPDDVIYELIQNVLDLLYEDEDKGSGSARAQRDKLGLKHIAYGFYSKSGKQPVEFKRDGDKFVQSNDSEYEKIANDRGEDGKDSAPVKQDSTPNDSTPSTDNVSTGEDGEGEEQPPNIVATPRPGNSKEAKRAAAYGSVAAELAVKYVEDTKEREKLEAEDKEGL